MTKIKLCGMKSALDIEYANELKPEYIGFIFYPGSKRYVTPEKAAELRTRLDKEVVSVGVFVDADKELILDLINKGVIGAVQLHGCEDEEYISELRKGYKMGDKVLRPAMVNVATAQ